MRDRYVSRLVLLSYSRQTRLLIYEVTINNTGLKDKRLVKDNKLSWPKQENKKEVVDKVGWVINPTTRSTQNYKANVFVQYRKL